MVKPITEETKEFSNINIKVVGVGNAGGSIVSRIYNKIDGVQFLVFNTDAYALKNVKADIKIQIGERTTHGRGAGKDPEKGKFAASEDKEKIQDVFKNTHITFLIAGLGGGTGTGGAPVIAKMSKDAGGSLIALVTTPFEFEGEERNKYAQEGLENLLKNVDTLIHIPNQKLFEIVDEKTPTREAFGKIDEIILRTISSISDLIYKPNLLHIDFADIYSIVENAGRGIVGMGYGKGEGRMEKAVRDTIDDPFIEKSEIMEAKNILISITGSPDLTLREIQDAISIIQSRISSPSRIPGVAIDENLNDEVKITLLATGIGKKTVMETEKHISKTQEILFEKEKKEESTDVNIDVPAWMRKKGNNMKIGICNEIFKDWDFEKVFSFIKKLGYEGLEIAPFTIADDVSFIPDKTIEEIKKYSEKTGVKIIGTHWLLVKPEGLSISTKDKNLRDKTSKYLCKLVDFTSKIGGELMVFGSPKQRKINEGQTYEEVKENLKEVLVPVLEKCQEKNIYLCIEPLARSETNFINKAIEAIEIIEEINHPYLKLHLDVKAMSDEGKPIPEIIEEGAKYLKHFHVNDKNLLGPGFGKIDYKPIIEKLKEIGYNGWLSVEVFDFSPGAEIIAEKSIQYLKKFL